MDWKSNQTPIIMVEVHSIIPPIVLMNHQYKPAAMERMKGVGDLKRSIGIVHIRRI